MATNKNELDFSKPIRVGGSNYDFLLSILEISKKYFKAPNGEDLPLDTLRTGYFGWTAESLATIAYNSVLSKGLLQDEKYLSTASTARYLYRFAKDLGFDNLVARPGSMNIVISMSLDELINYKNETGENFIITTKDKFFVGKDEYHLRYPIRISVNPNYNNLSEGIYTATYLLEEEAFSEEYLNTPSPFLSTYISIPDRRIIFEAEVFQIVKITKNFIYKSQDITSINYFLSEYTDQLCFFNVLYKEIDIAEVEKLNVIYGEASNEHLDGDETPYCNYEHNTSNSLLIYFNTVLPDSFVPRENSSLEVEMFTTKGYQGVIMFNGLISIELENNLYNMDVYGKQVSPSSPGRNVITLDQLKPYLLSYVRRRDQIVDDIDIKDEFDILSINYPDLVNNYIQIKKSRDDLDAKIYSAYLLFRDKDSKTMPTNSVNLKIIGNYIDNKDESVFKITDDGNHILIPAGQRIIAKINEEENYYSDYLFHYRPTDNLFNEEESIRRGKTWEDYYNIKTNDYLNYKIPFSMIISKYPYLRIGFRQTSFDMNSNTSIYKYSTYSNKSYMIMYLNWWRNEFDSNINNRKYYNLSFNLASNDIEDPTVLSCIALFYTKDEDGNREYLGYKECERLNEQENPISFSCKIESKEKSEDFNSIQAELNKITWNDITEKYEAEAGVTNVNIPEKCYISILVTRNFNSPGNYYILSGDNNNKLDYSSFLPLVPFASSIQVLEAKSDKELDFYRDLTKNSFSVISKENNGDYLIEQIPLIGSNFLTNYNNFTQFISEWNDYYSILEKISKKLIDQCLFNVKFYNTYGISRMFSSFTTNLLLHFKIKLNVDETEDLKKNIARKVVEFINTINSNESEELAFSNLSTLLENSFPEIKRIEKVKFGRNNMQVITSLGQQLNNETPEFLNLGYNYNTGEFTLIIDFI